MEKKIGIIFGCALILLLIGCGAINEKNHSDSTTTAGTSIESIDVDGAVQITKAGTYRLTGSTTEGTVMVDCDGDVTLILDSVNITNPSGPAIYGYNSSSITIELPAGSESTLTDGSTYETDSAGETYGKGVIFSNDDITITGDGSITLNCHYKHGISSDDGVLIENGNITINNAPSDGINANDWVTIDGGSLQITADSDLIGCDADVVVSGGSISGESGDEGIEGKNSIVINDGIIDIACQDDGINSGSQITINGGTTYITCITGDAIDCNGNTEGCITINGGFVLANGGNAPEGGIDADNASVVIDGGIVIASGSVNSPISDSSKQVSIVYGSFSENQPIGIIDEEGNTVFAFCPTFADTTVIISTPDFEIGQNYDIYIGGEITGECDSYGYYPAGTYNGGELTLSITTDTVVVEAGGSAQGMGGFGNGGRGQRGEFDGEFNPENMPQIEGFDSENMPQNGDFDPNNMPQDGDFDPNNMPGAGDRPDRRQYPGQTDNMTPPQGNPKQNN